MKNKIFLLFLFYLLLEEFSFKSFHFISLFNSDIHAGWSSSIQAGLSGGLPILSIFGSK